MAAEIRQSVGVEPDRQMLGADPSDVLPQALELTIFTTDLKIPQPSTSLSDQDFAGMHQI